ncbi:MAG: RNA polymerase sigma factor [Acidobacteriota bacterium]|nr:RNA polymerase sigma factor [Acidobacteriota bacterium]
MKDYAELSDLELAQRSGKGDENAFAEIVRRYTPRVFRFVSRFFRQRGVIEEVAQDVFLRIFTQLKSYEGRGSFEGWLTRITVNTCINQLRSAKRETELTVSALSEAESDWLEQKMSDAAAMRHQSDEEKLIAADLVNRVLETMSADDRLVLTLIDGEGHSIRDISGMTGWTESKVKIQAFRARRRMREAVENLMRKTPQPQQKQQKA